jgi:hypothetical protein
MYFYSVMCTSWDARHIWKYIERDHRPFILREKDLFVKYT